MKTGQRALLEAPAAAQHTGGGALPPRVKILALHDRSLLGHRWEVLTDAGPQQGAPVAIVPSPAEANQT